MELDHPLQLLRKEGGASDDPSDVVYQDQDAVDEDHTGNQASKRAPEHHDEPVHQQHVVASNRQDHKDSLNRYVQVGDRERGKDHYLNPEDGKLVLLRVQCAENYRRDPSLITTWSDPLECHPLVRAWKAFRESPQSVLTWTYNDWLQNRSTSDSSLPRSKKPYNPHGRRIIDP